MYNNTIDNKEQFKKQTGKKSQSQTQIRPPSIFHLYVSFFLNRSNRPLMDFQVFAPKTTFLFLHELMTPDDTVKAFSQRITSPTVGSHVGVRVWPANFGLSLCDVAEIPRQSEYIILPWIGGRFELQPITAAPRSF